MQRTSLLVILTLTMFIFLTAGAMAQEDNVIFKLNTPSQLQIPVFNNDLSKSSASVNCNLSIEYPNKTLMVTEDTMQFNQNGVYNYTLNKLSSIGSYNTVVTCNNGYVYGASNFQFIVTPTGEEMPGEIVQTFIYILFGVTIILLLFLLIINIAKFASLSVTVYDVAISFAVMMLALFTYWLANNYLINRTIADQLAVWIQISGIVGFVIPLLGLIVTMIFKTIEKKRPLRVRETLGEFGGNVYGQKV